MQTNAAAVPARCLIFIYEIASRDSKTYKWPRGLGALLGHLSRNEVNVNRFSPFTIFLSYRPLLHNYIE